MDLRSLGVEGIIPAWISWDKGALHCTGTSANIFSLLSVIGWAVLGELYIHEKRWAALIGSWLLHHGVHSITDCIKFSLYCTVLYT